MTAARGGAVAWEAAADGLDGACRAAIERACAELACRPGPVRGVERLAVSGVAFALKRGRRRGLRGALLRLGLARSRSARAAELARLMRAAGLATPRVFGVYAGGVPPGDVLVMEWRPGVTLTERLGAERGGPEESAAVLEDAGRAVAVLHGAGFTHRDLKGANVLVAEGGAVELLDLDGARRERVTEALRARDLARLALSVEVAGGSVARLLRAYEAARPEGERTGGALAGEVEVRVAAKRARNVARGRGVS